MLGIKRMKFFVGLPLILKFVVAMRIPQDTETIGGYIAIMDADEAPTDEYFEARNMADDASLGHPIRDKRSAVQQFADFPTLHAPQPQPDAVPVVPFDSKNGELLDDARDDDAAGNFAYTKAFPPRKAFRGERHKREAEVNATVTEKENDSNGTHTESLPSPAKQIMRNPADDMVGYWTQAPHEYARMNFDDDASADASTLNEGINARAPRVNFITQQKRTFDDDDATVSATRSEFYRNGGGGGSAVLPVNDRVGDRMLAPAYRERERERERFLSREPVEADEFPRRFDRYER